MSRSSVAKVRTTRPYLFDNTDLEAVAQAAAARRRWEFLLVGAPLPFQTTTGSPINPLAPF
jgi:hypothetical protein